MIEQIITASRSEAEQDDGPEPVDLQALAREVRDMIEERATEKGLDLDPAVDDDIGSIVTRARPLRQILVNLVTNAVKFTDRGRVAIEIQDGDPVRLRVRDTGIGMDPETRERVFERFWQADASATRTSDGLGIGL